MENTPTTHTDRLAEVLFGGEVAAADIKLMPGWDEEAATEEVAAALLASLKRVGLVVDGKLVNKND